MQDDYLPQNIVVAITDFGNFGVRYCSMNRNIVLFFLFFYTPCSTKLKGGILVSPCPSVCASVDRIVSALSLLQYSPDPFHIYTSYQATSEGVLRVKSFSTLKYLKFWQILWICNFDFVLFWLGIQYELVNSMGNHGAAGVSSERRRSSCSSFCGSFCQFSESTSCQIHNDPAYSVFVWYWFCK